jgi:putative flippase GtrA
MHMPIERFGLNKKSAVGFFWHQAIGALCFFFDIGIIFLAIHVFHIHYPIAVTIGFICATFLNYALARSTIYANSARKHRTALIYFFAIASVFLLITVGGTVFLREVVGIKLYLARTLVGIFIGVAGYFLDCLVTFKLR